MFNDTSQKLKVMLPSKEFNIYPKSDENLKALISHYFDKYDINQEGGIEKLKEKTSLDLNQIEFILRKLAEAYEPIFKKHLNRQIEILNLLEYGFDALMETKVNGSNNRARITKEFEEFVILTEK